MYLLQRCTNIVDIILEKWKRNILGNLRTIQLIEGDL